MNKKELHKWWTENKQRFLPEIINLSGKKINRAECEDCPLNRKLHAECIDCSIPYTTHCTVYDCEKCKYISGGDTVFIGCKDKKEADMYGITEEFVESLYKQENSKKGD